MKIVINKKLAICVKRLEGYKRSKQPPNKWGIKCKKPQILDGQKIPKSFESIYRQRSAIDLKKHTQKPTKQKKWRSFCTFHLLYISIFNPISLLPTEKTPMAENQNSTRMTRAAAKRKASATDENPVSKKRVVLGELPNISNVAAPLIPIQERETQKLKSTLIASKKKTKNAPTRDFESGSSDPQMCGPYVADICAYLREMEVKQSTFGYCLLCNAERLMLLFQGKLKQRPLHDYIEKVQSDLTPNMRGVLMDWLVEVAEEYKLVSDTLYLTVSYVDRFLSVKTINRQRLQLVGVSAMLIAS